MHEQLIEQRYPIKQINQEPIISFPSTDSPLQNQLHSQQQSINQHVKLIQKHIKAHQTRMLLKGKIKKLIKRKNIIKQLIDSEQNYIRDLGFIVSDFKMKLLSKGILDNQQAIVMFSNVDEIRRLHEDFFTILYNEFVDYSHYQVLFADVLKMILFFRIYIEYLNNFPTACQLVEKLEKSDNKFGEFLIEIHRSKKYRLLRIEDYLVKPVQRLPKYVLLLKEIKKNTEPDHPDYKNIVKALQKFEQVNINNNEKLTKIANNYKLLEIAQNLKLPDGFITPTVEFILEETVQIYIPQHKSIKPNCVLYLLNTAAIIAIRYSFSHNQRKSNFGKQKLELIVPLKHGVSLQRGQSQSIYKHLTLQSPDGDSCTFICSSNQEMNFLQSRLKKEIERVESQTLSKLNHMLKSDIHNNQNILINLSIIDLIPEVTILGTAERNDKMLKYTVYIIQVKVKMVCQKLFLRFSELIQIEQSIKSDYPSLSMKQTLVTSSWLKNHQQKTIEERKINIERFLKELLSKPQIITNGSKILLKLGLCADFYELPKKLLERKVTENFMKKSSFANIFQSQGKLKKANTENTKQDSQFPSFIRDIKKKPLHPKIKAQPFNASCRMSIFRQQEFEEEDEKEKVLDGADEKENSESQQSENEEDSNRDNECCEPQSFHKKIGQGLTIQDILKANEVDLGHYTRYSELLKENSANSKIEATINRTTNKSPSQIFKRNQALLKQINEDFQITILIISIQYNYITQPVIDASIPYLKKADSGWTKNKKGQIKGYKPIRIHATKYQRVQSIIPQIAKLIHLKFYKDFRLFIQKEFASRVIDDDELIYKIKDEIDKNNAFLVFKKYIYIDHQIQEKQIKNDRVRLSLISAQIINDIRKGRYLLSYSSYLIFSVLGVIIFEDYLKKINIERTSCIDKVSQQKNRFKKKYRSLQIEQSNSEDAYSLSNNLQQLNMLAKQSIDVNFPKYSSFNHKENVWTQDFIKSYHIILRKLLSISKANSKQKNLLHNILKNQELSSSLIIGSQSINLPNQSSLVKGPIKQEANILSYISQQDYEQPMKNQHKTVSAQKAKTEISIKYLAMQAIIKQIEYNQNDIYGGVGFSVQISECFKQQLIKNHNLGQYEESYLERDTHGDRFSYRQRLNIGQKEETRNCWLVIKYNKLLLLSINLRAILFQLRYSLVKKVQTYSSSIILVLKKHRKQLLGVDEIKLKTTASYEIRDLVLYYKNYRNVKRKLERDSGLQDSIIQLTKQQIVQVQMGETEEYVV